MNYVLLFMLLLPLSSGQMYDCLIEPKRSMTVIEMLAATDMYLGCVNMTQSLNTSLLSTLAELQIVNDTLTYTNDALTSALAELQDTNDTLTYTNDALTSALAELQIVNDTLTYTNDALTYTNDALTSALAELQIVNDTLTYTKDASASALAAALAELQAARNEIANYESTCDTKIKEYNATCIDKISKCEEAYRILNDSFIKPRETKDEVGVFDIVLIVLLMVVVMGGLIFGLRYFKNNMGDEDEDDEVEYKHRDAGGDHIYDSPPIVTARVDLDEVGEGITEGTTAERSMIDEADDNPTLPVRYQEDTPRTEVGDTAPTILEEEEVVTVDVFDEI